MGNTFLSNFVFRGITIAIPFSLPAGGFFCTTKTNPWLSQVEAILALADFSKGSTAIRG